MRNVLENKSKVSISRSSEDAPELSPVLSILAKDIKSNINIHAISPTLLNRVQILVADVNIDLDAPLSKPRGLQNPQ